MGSADTLVNTINTITFHIHRNEVLQVCFHCFYSDTFVLNQKANIFVPNQNKSKCKTHGGQGVRHWGTGTQHCGGGGGQGDDARRCAIRRGCTSIRIQES